MRALLIAAVAAFLTLATACQNIAGDLSQTTSQSVRSDLSIGMSKADVLKKYGGVIYLQGKTVADDEELIVYMFIDGYYDFVHNVFSLVDDILAFTRKNLFILFDKEGKVKDYKLNGYFMVEAFGFTEYWAYVHPLNDEQLASAKPLTMDEGKESYFRYLTEVKGRDPATFTKQDLEGNRQTYNEYGFFVKQDAIDFAGELKDVILNDKAMLDEMAGEKAQNKTN